MHDPLVKTVQMLLDQTRQVLWVKLTRLLDNHNPMCLEGMMEKWKEGNVVNFSFVW